MIVRRGRPIRSEVHVLEMRAAAFARRGATIVPPTDLLLGERESAALICPDARAAAVAARMAAGIVKASEGAVYICGFDPRLQPVQSKRLAGFVSHALTSADFASLDRYIDYRAALWGLPRAQSIVQARHLRSAVREIDDAYAFPLVAALLARPALLVLDRPAVACVSQIRSIAHDCAVLSTHAGAQQADRFAAVRV